MAHIHRLFQKAFPVLAIAGLLVAGWGLIMTPDESKAAVGSDGVTTAAAWGGRGVWASR